MNLSLFGGRAIACAAAAVAVAGVTMLGVTPAAQAAPAARPNTHLSSMMSSPVAGKCNDTGQLTNANNGAPVGDAVVVLLHGGTSGPSKTTNSSGHVTFSVATSSVGYTLFFPGNNSFVSSKSAAKFCG